MVSRLHPILRAMVEFVFHVGLPEPVAPAIELNDAEWIEQLQILNNALLSNKNNNNGVEDEPSASNTGSLAVAASSSSSTISSLDRTLTSSNSQSSSDLSLLTSASSFPSGLGNQSDKEDSVGHGDTQSNLDGQNENSGEQDGSHDPKSQKEEEKKDSAHGGGNGNEIGSSLNQDELPSQDIKSPAQIAASDNGGNGKHVGDNKVDASDNSSDSDSLDSDQSDWNSRDDEVLDGALPDPRHCSRLNRRVNEVLKEAFDDLVIFRDPKTVTKDQMVETLLRHFPESSVQGLLMDQDVFDRITPAQLAKIKIKIETFANVFLDLITESAPEALVQSSPAVEFLDLITESAPEALVPSSPAVDALIATPTLVLDGLIHYLIRLSSSQGLDQDHPNFIIPPGVGDVGIALDSKASSFLELCVLEFNPELCSWLMEAVERVGQAYDCDILFDSLKAEFLKMLPQIGASVPLFPRFEEFNGALSDSFLQVLIDRFLTADFDFVIETLYRQLIRHNFGAAQDFPEFFSGYGSGLETDEETSFGNLEEIPPFPEIVLSVMLCKRPFIEVIGRRFSLKKLETIQLRSNENAAEKVCSEIFKVVVEQEVGLDVAIKVVEAAIENQTMKFIVSKASQYVADGLRFPSDLSEFISDHIGRAISQADYCGEVSGDLPQVVRRRRYVDFPGISGSILCTFQWGSFLCADDSWTRLEGITSYLSHSDDNHLSVRRLLMEKLVPLDGQDAQSRPDLPELHLCMTDLLASWNARKV